MKRFIKWMYDGYGSVGLAWFTIIFGFVTVNLTLLLVYVGLSTENSPLVYTAMPVSLIGNFQTWTAYHELTRRKREKL